MKVKEFIVEHCERNEIRDFVEKGHYSKNINGLSCTHNFKLTYEGEIIGGCIFGQIAMSGVWKNMLINQRS